MLFFPPPPACRSGLLANRLADDSSTLLLRLVDFGREEVAVEVGGLPVLAADSEESGGRATISFVRPRARLPALSREASWLEEGLRPVFLRWVSLRIRDIILLIFCFGEAKIYCHYYYLSKVNNSL